MKKLLTILLFCSLLVLFCFFMFGGLEQGMEQMLQRTSSRAVYSGFSFLFLASDIVLPVPSSLIMIANGKVLGWMGGALLSIAAGMTASSIGFLMGRKANRFFDRFFGVKEREAGNKLFQQLGTTAIAVSKALPVLAEAVSILAGTTSIAWKTFLLYSMAGHWVTATLYALIGHYAAGASSSLYTIGIIAVALLVSWMLQRLLLKKQKPVATPVATAERHQKD